MVVGVGIDVVVVMRCVVFDSVLCSLGLVVLKEMQSQMADVILPRFVSVSCGGIYSFDVGVLSRGGSSSIS